MNKKPNLLAVIVTLVTAAIGALILTWAVSSLLLKLGISGFLHTLVLMVILPLTFAVIALFLARKLLLQA